MVFSILKVHHLQDQPRSLDLAALPNREIHDVSDPVRDRRQWQDGVLHHRDEAPQCDGGDDDDEHHRIVQRGGGAEGVVDLVQCGRAVNRWIPVMMMELLLFDVGRVLRGERYLWLDKWRHNSICKEKIYNTHLIIYVFKVTPKVKWE